MKILIPQIPGIATGEPGTPTAFWIFYIGFCCPNEESIICYIFSAAVSNLLYIDSKVV